ncbi:MAG: hypothetical protein KBS82_05200 [Oscillospiraceae bacterium]|nr:hypothetical protein [Candidatus Limimonas egerieequi]
MTRLIDLTGQKFGRLTVLERAPSTGGQAEWICKCDCGNIKKVKGQHLRSGAIVSCGCYNREATSKARTVDLTGRRFGKLSVIEYAGSKNGRAVWRCMCDCGNIVDVYSSYLQTGDTKSCGCIMSYREVMIEEYLKEHNILYEKQYTFPDLRGKKYPLRFDFAIFNSDKSLRCLVEYQGEQHFDNIFGLPDDKYIESLSRDDMKREYCHSHNIDLFELTNEENIYLEIGEILNGYTYNC